jgi:hypothetical protein
MTASELLAGFVAELLARHATLHKGAGLHQTLGGGDHLQVEEVTPPCIWQVSYLTPLGRHGLQAELAVEAFVDDDGRWYPYAICRPPIGLRAYGSVDTIHARLTVTDADNQWALAAYCDAWTFHLRRQGWLEQGVRR